MSIFDFTGEENQKQKRKTKADDIATNPEREAMFSITRMLNKFASLVEYSDTQVLRCLLGHPSYYNGPQH